MRLPAALAFFMIVLMALPVAAGVPVRKLGQYGKWTAYTYKDKGGPVCYMTVRPAKSEWKMPATLKNAPSQKKTQATKTSTKKTVPSRGDTYLMVTLRPSETFDPVISYRAGYIFKSSSEVAAKMGPKPYNLFTEKDQAWARSTAIDVAFTKALRKSPQLVMEGQPAAGPKSVDRFDLTGTDKAYLAIAKACGINS